MISDSPLLQQQYRLFQDERKFRFYLGAPNSAWLSRHPGIPLFVSRRQMQKTRFRPAVVRWACDSGGFTELQKFGRWTINAHEYSVLLNRYDSMVGMLDWAAPQDWMCEPVVIQGGRGFVGTGLSVREHQRRTVDNFLELQNGVCRVKIIPVIQGYTIDEYHDCIELYSRNGIDLTEFDTVGVGSICRRQATAEAVQILRSINERGINIHAFGLKQAGLCRTLDFLASADSMAWSFVARYAGPSTCGKINSRTKKPIKNCANCYHAAVEWHEKTMRLINETYIGV